MDTIARVGDFAPEFELKDLNGQVHSLSGWLGSIVVLNFWSAECVHSRRADEVLEQLSEEWGEDVSLWCIASNENEGDELVRSKATKMEIDRLLRDRNHEVADTYGAITTPQVFVIDRRRVLRYTGALDDVSLRHRRPTRNYLREAVRAVREGMDPEPSMTSPFGCAIVRQTL